MTHTQTTFINRIDLRSGKEGARPVEVGELASVFEKSATELKQQVIFNVGNLNRISQLPELTASAV